MKMNFRCDNCSELIETDYAHPTTRFCSPKCRKENRRKKALVYAKTGGLAPPLTKVCAICMNEFVTKNANYKVCSDPFCKEEKRKRDNAAYRQKNLEFLLEKDRKYHWEHHDECLERGRRYYAENIEAIREKDRLRDSEPERRAYKTEYSQRYFAINRGRISRERRAVYAQQRDELQQLIKQKELLNHAKRELEKELEK